MNRYLYVLLLLLPLRSFTQPFVPETVFFDSCETAVANTAKFLAGTQLSDEQHRNILVCYNQLVHEIGEDFDRLSLFRTTNFADYLDIGILYPYTVGHNPYKAIYERYHDTLTSTHDLYVDRLELFYETSFGKGGALYFPQLRVDAKTADGRTYLNLSYEEAIQRQAADLVGTWEIHAWEARPVSAMDDALAEASLGKTIVITPSRVLIPFDMDTATCTSAYYSSEETADFYVGPFGLEKAYCIQYVLDFGNWPRYFLLPDENTMVYELDGIAFLCCRQGVK